MIGKRALVADVIVLPTSTISPYEINPVSGSAKRLAETQNPDMNAAGNDARSINRALRASCAHGVWMICPDAKSSRRRAHRGLYDDVCAGVDAARVTRACVRRREHRGARGAHAADATTADIARDALEPERRPDA
jgi:hypothetical protein